ncbi:MAG: Eco57I restriction-modification methylase domain-containing protein [Promethearchaeota archaeon]
MGVQKDTGFLQLELRKQVASYYTKADAGKILAELSIEKHDELVADLACGSGKLLKEVYLRKKRLLEQTRQFTEVDHKRFLENEILGIEVMNSAAHLAVIQLASQSPEFATDFVQIAVKDSTTIEIGQIIRPLSNKFPFYIQQRPISAFLRTEEEKRHALVQEGVLGVNNQLEKHFEIREQNVVIMNPPFTKKQTIVSFSSTYRRELLKRFSGYDNILSTNSKYCYFFIALADKVLSKNGTLAFVLPITFLRGNDAKNLREWLLERYHIQYIILRKDNPNFSEDTDFRECLFIAKKIRNESNQNTTLVFLKKLDPNAAQQIQAIKMQLPTNTTQETDLILAKNILQRDLTADNFFQEIAFFNFKLTESWKQYRHSDVLTNFEDLGIDVRSKNEPERGGGSFSKLSLNAASRTYIRGDPWQITRIEPSHVEVEQRRTNEVIQIPRSNIRLTFRLITYITQMNVTDLEEYVIDSSFQGYRQFRSLVGLESIDWHIWQNYLDSRTSNFFLAERIDITAPGYSMIAFYSERPRAWSRVSASIKNLNDDVAKILCLWFNSSFGILEYLFQRDEDRGGWMQLHKYIVQKLKVPNTKKLNEVEKQNILATFEDTSKEDFPSILVQFLRNCSKNMIPEEIMEIIRNQRTYPDLEAEIGILFEPRRKIDSSILKNIFHIDENQHERILSQLYVDILREIFLLKKMME